MAVTTPNYTVLEQDTLKECVTIALLGVTVKVYRRRERYHGWNGYQSYCDGHRYPNHLATGKKFSTCVRNSARRLQTERRTHG